MNIITKIINELDELLSPLAEWAKDENFRGEVLKSVGATPKTDAASKEKSKKKFEFIIEILTKLKEKLGLDKSDIPKVSNIVALGMLVPEIVLIGKTLNEILKECTFEGTDGSEAEVGLAFFNAQRAILGLLTLNVFKRTLPEAAIAAEAMGILYDESDEVRRALDILTFGSIDGLRPNGDIKMDLPYRITQAIFLYLSVSFAIDSTRLRKTIAPAGQFLFNFGHELPPEKDQFPNADKIANRTIQAYFIPGDFSHRDDDIIVEEMPEAFKAALFLSFASIPVYKTENGKQVIAGFQYVLGVEGDSNALTYSKDKIELSLPSSASGNFIWGHETPVEFFGKGVVESTVGTNVPPLIQFKYKGAKPEGFEPPKKENGVEPGDITIGILPRKTSNNIDLEFSIALTDFQLSVSGEGRDGFLQKILPESASAKLKLNLKFIYSALSNSFRVEGLENSNGFLFDFSVDKKIFGALTIPTFYIGITPLVDEKKKATGISLESSVLMNFQLGPFAMTVDRLGLKALLNLPKKEAASEAGFDLDIGLKPPTGIGFSVNASVVKGGGFLSIDPDNHQYYGVGELNIEFEGDDETFCLSLKVIAIILTQLPDGSKGFSFLVMASI